MDKRKNLNRFTSLVVIMIMIFTAILSKLAYLQIVKYEDNKEQANNQSIRQLTEPAPRGNILDKNGSLLATSIQSYVLTFMEAEDSKKQFFTTMDKTFKLLDDTGEKLQDTFQLKIDPFRFEFNTSDADTIKALELRFKKDRGLDFKVQQELYPKQKDELTIEQQKKIDEELLKISPEDTFYALVKDPDYQLYKLLGYNEEQEKDLLKKGGKDITDLLLKDHSLEQLRKYMLVKDAIKLQKFSGFKPVTIANNMKRDSAFIFLQKLNELSGIDVTIQPIRSYPYNELASSVIGYIGAIDGGQKDKYEERGYDLSTDFIGKAGIESAFEDRLKGSKGGTTVKVNKYGRKTEELFRLEPYPGQSIQLSIDKNIQYMAEKVLDDEMKYLQSNSHREPGLNTANATRGAVVVEDVNTGKILAMVSTPSFDPNIMAVPGRLTPELRQQYFAPDLKAFGEDYIKRRGLSISLDDLFPLVDKKDPKNTQRKDPYDIYPKPFLNYATMGAVPPGSTFKPLTAVAGLEEGLITPGEVIPEVPIASKYPEFKSYQAGGAYHGGVMNLSRALEVSSNYYFYDVGYRLYKNGGLDKLAQYAWKFGLGKDPKSNVRSSTGIEIAENTSGQVYNYESSKRLVAATSVFDFVDFIQNGKYITSNKVYTFKPFPIGINEEDGEGLKQAKEELKKALRDELMKDYEDKDKATLFNNFNEELKGKFQKLVNALPEDEKSQYSKADISSMSAATATYVYFDKRIIITTGANVLDASIGQGMNEFTPLQLTNYIATIVNGGIRYRTSLVNNILDSNGKIIEEVKPEVLENVNMSPSTVSAVKEGMKKVTEEGTAVSVFKDFPIQTGGKTGTATFREKEVQGKVGREDFGVYVGFAPFDKPEIAVTILIYDGGHGFFGANVAKAVYEEYFRDRILQQNPNYKFTYSYKLDH